MGWGGRRFEDREDSVETSRERKTRFWSSKLGLISWKWVDPENVPRKRS